MKTDPITRCPCCNVHAVKVRHGINKGRYGWTRVVGDTLEYSPRTFAEQKQAFTAAHEHYGRQQ